MAKKRFTDNLLDLFGTADQKAPSVQNDASTDSAQQESQANSKRAAQKDFTASLQSFLAEAFEDSFENQLGGGTKTRPVRPRNSLDMLIRDTLEPTSIELQDQPSRRVTLAFDPSKLEKLRAIARLEKAMLKDIIDDIVAEFIRDYEAQKGNLRGN